MINIIGIQKYCFIQILIQSFYIQYLNTLFKNMGEDYIILPENASKQSKYENVLQALQLYFEKNVPSLAYRCNLIAHLHQQFRWLWIGYYYVHKKQGTPCLSLGSFQGPPACVRIFKGFGVCGKSWELDQSIVVPDVNSFEGHIACSSRSKSQIVIPIHRNGEFVGLLDIDSQKLQDFDNSDQYYLEKIIKVMECMSLFEDW